ncbi:hypothetical protein EDB84DRAFT_481283 [Lactarius hengduanensis]|nr:hypothetical protein EDB84DRAFT_481283 [Lactarius hengduanensis]
MAIGIVEATATAVSPSAGALAADNNLRIASLTIAAYDYLLTLPAEYRLYKSSHWRSTGLILFVLLRYSSMMVLVISNVGFFHHTFTPKTCGHFYMVAPVFKVIQMMTSQAILAIRTYGISQRTPWVGWTLLLSYTLVVGFQWFFSLYARIPSMIDGNCTPGTAHPESAVSTWSFYLVAMLFDCLTLSISTFYLIRVKAVASTSASQLCKILLYDGLGYFVVLTVTNAANILLYRGVHHAIQTTGASLGYAVTWIMSQRILIHPRDARTDQMSAVLSRIPNSRAVMSALRFDKGSTHPTRVEPGDSPEDECGNTESDFNLQVRVDRSIVVNARAQDECPKDQDLFWDRV